MIKLCAYCDCEILRRPDDRFKQWERQKFCSNRCKSRDEYTGRSTNKEGYVDPESDKLATQQLLSAIFVVYERVAKQRGLKSLNEAAYMLGMRP